MAEQNTTLIIYHEVAHGVACKDGYAAAWVASKITPNAQLMGCVYDDVPIIPDHIKTICIVDFSFPNELLLEWAENRTILVIDHHKSEAARLRQIQHINIAAKIDTNECGATLAWSTWFGKPVPLFLQYIKDRDLWQWELPGSRELDAAIEEIGMSFELFDLLESANMFQLQGLMRFGGKLLTRKKKRVAEIEAKSYSKMYGKGQINVCFLDSNEAKYTSEVCELMYKKNPSSLFSVCYHRDSAIGSHMFNYVISFRSDKNGTNVDVGDLAKSLGGGGHRNASGVQLEKLPEFLKKPIKIEYL